MTDPFGKYEDKLHKQCQTWKGNILKNNNVVKFMMHQLDKIGCPIQSKNFICRPCEEEAGGHFLAGQGIILCENKLRTEQQTADTMIHESIHAFDQCRAIVDWNDCRHHACSEIRAANLSGDCGFFNELSRGNIWDFRVAKKHQDCVKRRAVLSIRMNAACAGHSEQVVDEVFEQCFKDLEPFDEIY